MAAENVGQSIVRTHCNTCGIKTKHELLHRAESKWEEEIDHNFAISGGDIYDMLQCCGCEHICLKHITWFSEDAPWEIVERFYPPIISRRKPDWLAELKMRSDSRPDFIVEILEEIYESLHSNSRRLAAMGTRSLIEQIMVDQVGEHGDFSKNMGAFYGKGHITSIQRDRLVTVLDFGHASVHRQFKPDPEDIRTALDIVENLIADIYVHPERAKRLAERVPGRKKLPPQRGAD